jgi:hypothetical protein
MGIESRFPWPANLTRTNNNKTGQSISIDNEATFQKKKLEKPAMRLSWAAKKKSVNKIKPEICQQN